MIPMTSEKEETRRRLALISARLARIESDRWTREIDGDGESIVTVRAVTASASRAAGAPAGPGISPDGQSPLRPSAVGGQLIGHEAPEVMLTFGEEATHDERAAIFALREDVRFLLDIIDLSRRLLAGRAREERAKDYAAQAAMKCAEPAFQRFLGADSAAVADIRLKARLGIESKRELKTDSAAADRWRALMRDFSDWMRGQG